MPLPRRLLVRLLVRLDASPLPMTDVVRLELEWELIGLINGPGFYCGFASRKSYVGRLGQGVSGGPPKPHGSSHPLPLV